MIRYQHNSHITVSWQQRRCYVNASRQVTQIPGRIRDLFRTLGGLAASAKGQLLKAAARKLQTYLHFLHPTELCIGAQKLLFRILRCSWKAHEADQVM